MYYFIPQHNIGETCTISGFCRCGNEIFALLGCYAS